MNVRRTVPRVVPWLREKTRSPADRLEPGQDRVVRRVDQGPVVRLDHPHGRPHVACETASPAVESPIAATRPPQKSPCRLGDASTGSGLSRARLVRRRPDRAALLAPLRTFDPTGTRAEVTATFLTLRSEKTSSRTATPIAKAATQTDPKPTA